MKYKQYENAKDFLYNKNLYINNYCELMLNRLQRMFEYTNLTDTLPCRELELMLMTNGNIFITKVNDKLYAFTGGLGGELNEYYEPTVYTVANPYLKLSKDFKIDIDGVLIRNDSNMIGLLPTLYKNAVMNNDCEITLNMLSVILRAQYIISASDDRTRKNAELYINKIKNGDFSIIADSQFTNGVKLQNGAENTNIINQMIQLAQYIKGNALNEIGLNANYIMKKERLITSEININETSILPLVENMLDERKKGIEKVNRMFGTNIEVNLACVWKEQVVAHENEPYENNEVKNE